MKSAAKLRSRLLKNSCFDGLSMNGISMTSGCAAFALEASKGERRGLTSLVALKV
jgi:hypothetical protein